MTTQVNVEVKVQIGAEEKIISTEEREATWNEQAKINALYTELGEEYATAQEFEDRAVQYAHNIQRIEEEHPETVDYLSLSTIVRLHKLASNESTEQVLRRMHREGKLGKWL
jgi:S-methylmethionine-dependent homocysteine/selenocysteine methylase